MHTKWTARRLAADAMFAAMVTVLGLVSISTGNPKITVEARPDGFSARCCSARSTGWPSAGWARCCTSCCASA